MKSEKRKNIYLDGIMGLVVGDALGVPVEFKSREELKADPVICMRGYGTYNLPKGTWSDDSSMTLATLDSLRNGYKLTDIMDAFVAWLTCAKYTPYEDVFDIGFATRNAIIKYMTTNDVKNCGGNSEYDNGNGSLMRILPICLYLYERQKMVCTSEDEAIYVLHEVSGLTHNHIRSKMACGIYFFCVKAILGKNGSLREKLQSGISAGMQYYQRDLRNFDELNYFVRLRDLATFSQLEESEIKSTGYVVDSLEAAIWCLIKTQSYKECVLKAVNLGNDTDTIAAIAGGLAGVEYGYEGIPVEWIESIAKKEWIKALCNSSCENVKNAKKIDGIC